MHSLQRMVSLITGLTALCVLPVGRCQAPSQPAAGKNPVAADVAKPPKVVKSADAPASKLVKYVSPDTLFESDTYSKVAIVNTPSRTVYFSGTIPVDKGYNVVGRDDLRAQIKETLKSLSIAMEAVGVTKDDIVKVSVDVVYKNNRDTFTVAEELATYFGRDDPPVTTITGSTFIVADGILVQIEAVAVLPPA